MAPGGASAKEPNPFSRGLNPQQVVIALGVRCGRVRGDLLVHHIWYG